MRLLFQGCYGAPIQGCYGILLQGCYGILLRCYGAPIQGCYGAPIQGCYGILLRCYGTEPPYVAMGLLWGDLLTLLPITHSVARTVAMGEPPYLVTLMLL